MAEALRILVVEDEAPILLYLGMVIEDEGHDLVGTAMGSRDAIALIETKRPELILLDLHLADGATGINVARCACAADIDVVFMTANASQVLEFEGALGVLAKPFTRTAVSKTLRYLAECIQDPPPKLPRPPEFTAAQRRRSQTEQTRRASRQNLP